MQASIFPVAVRNNWLQDWSNAILLVFDQSI